MERSLNDVTNLVYYINIFIGIIARYFMEEENYNLNSEQIRNIAEGYAWLAQGYNKLKAADSFREQKIVAEGILKEAIPFYKENLPDGMRINPRQFVNPGELEKTCKEITKTDSYIYDLELETNSPAKIN